MSRSRGLFSIRVIASLAAVILLAAAVLAMATVSERHATRTLTEEIETRLLLTARNLALVCREALLEDYPELVLAPIVKDLQSERAELAFVIATDADGAIRGHVDMQKLGMEFQIPSTWVLAHKANMQAGEELWMDPNLLVAVAPVTLGNGEQAGRAIIGLRRDYLTARVAAARKSQITVFAAVLMLGTLAAVIIVTWLLRPIAALRNSLERIGRGDLDTRLQVRGRNELALLAHTVNRMASQLKRAQHDLIQTERLNHEMQLAQEIQNSLRPPDRSDHGSFVIHASQRAATEVGGDYCGVFELPEGRVGLAIADVAGKGLAGCLSASMLAAFMRAYHSIILSPAKLLTSLDRQLCDSLAPGTFVTMFYGVLEPRSGLLQFSSAGHLPSAVYRRAKNTVEWHHPRGRPLASVRSQSRKLNVDASVLSLEPGDLLIQFTDGITEAWYRGDRNQQFGFERVQLLLMKFGAKGAQEVISRLQNEVDDWVGHHTRPDDETILVVGYEGASQTIGQDGSQRSSGVATLRSIDDQELYSRLKTKREHGDLLALASNMSALLKIKPWLDEYSRRLGLDPGESPAHIALYEICANIIEHGYGHDPNSTIEVFWVEPEDPAPSSDVNATLLPSFNPSQRLSASYFAICDRAAAFRPNSDTWEFRTEDVVERKGRGLGLSIVHRVATEVDYRTSRTYGNITLLRLASRRDTRTEV